MLGTCNRTNAPRDAAPGMNELAPTDATPWSPGLASTIPAHLMARATLFDPANALVDWDTAKALSDVTGIKPLQLATFRAERLAFHHVVIRVTVETHVPDGPAYADLGIALRQMAIDIYNGPVTAELPAITKAFDDMRDKARAFVKQELDTRIYAPPPPPEPEKGFLKGLFSKTPPPPPTRPRDELALTATDQWRKAQADDPLHKACHRALARAVGGVLSHRGALMIDRGVLEDVAVNLVSNDFGSDLISDMVAPLFDKGVETLGLKRLPAQENPVVLNAKGASASGKSTIRSQQKLIARKLGLDWQDFAIVSPDYWRKMMIDYDGLGDDYKYAAMLTGQELEVIDRKLDALMAKKAQSGNVPHMLIDRFRFDSFQTGKNRAENSTLLTRFAARVYMFFLITPPEQTVIRAFQRGIETGRYKAVDDLLFHNIEAYTGMPDLFLNWANTRDRWTHYEFLDNSVAQGETPRSVAFGQNGRLVIADLEKLCDIERFRHVNVDATDPDKVLSRELTRHEAMAFPRRIMAELDEVIYLVPGTDRIFAHATSGKLRLDPKSLPAPFAADDFGDTFEETGDLGTLEAELRSDVIGA